MTNTKDTFKLELTNVNKLINEAIKPDTIINIQNKFGLQFPFQVKRVKCSGLGIGGYGKGAIITVTGYKKAKGGTLAVKDTRVEYQGNYQSVGAENYKDYVLYE